MTSVKTKSAAILLALAVLSVVCSLPAQTNQKAQAWGTPANGLEMSLSLDPATAPPPAIPAITLHLRNVGSASLNVLLGGGCTVLYPNSVVLSLTDSSGNATRLTYLGPDAAGCAGASVVFIVPLSPNEEHSIPLKLDYYKILSDITHRYEYAWKPGSTYSVQAELETKPEETIKNVWNGLVKSDKLEIHFPSGN
jgi:hypothetical protein